MEPGTFKLSYTTFLPSLWHGWAFPARRSQTDGCPPLAASPPPGRWSPWLPAGSPLPAGTPEWPFGLQSVPKIQREGANSHQMWKCGSCKVPAWKCNLVHNVINISAQGFIIDWLIHCMLYMQKENMWNADRYLQSKHLESFKPLKIFVLFIHLKLHFGPAFALTWHECSRSPCVAFSVCLFLFIMIFISPEGPQLNPYDSHRGTKRFRIAPTYTDTLMRKDNRTLSPSLTHCQWALPAHSQSQKEDYFYHAGHI